MIQIDHFIWAVPNLEEAVTKFQKLSGVEPKFGGQHVSVGTKNALVSLGQCYLEFLAVDTTLNVSKNPITELLQKNNSPFFLGWGLQCTDFLEVQSVVNQCGLTLSKIEIASRLTPDGVTLKYEFADILGLDNLESVADYT